MSASTSSKAFIPNSLKKIIQNLKEIVKNHSDEEIHAMLKDCNMDPNETVQRLLLQDPFHEVKRKRDKRKENIRELVDGRMKPTSQWRGSNSGKRNYPSRSISQDVVTVNNFKNQNRVQQTMEKGIEISSSSGDAKNKLTTPTSLAADMPNGPAKTSNPVRKPQSAANTYNIRTVPSNIENLNKATTKIAEVPAAGLQHSITLKAASNANPLVQEPSGNAQVSSNVRTIKRKTGKHQVANKTVLSKASEKTQGESQVDGNLTSDASQATRPLSRASSGSRPSSNYSNRSQQLNGPQKVVGPLKEWKPKSTIVKPAPVSEKVENVDGEQRTLESSICYPSSDDTSSKLRTRLEALQVSDTRHVIIPDHLQVSETERTGLSFGSFDANFGLLTSVVKHPESLEGSTEFTEPTGHVVENIQEAASSPQIASASDQEVELADHSPSSAEIQENIESAESEIPSSNQTAPEYDQSKTEAEPSQNPVAQAAPTYSNFGLAPQMIGNQFVKVEAVESLGHDSTRNSSFQVQQQFDPATSYYASVYRPAVADGDVRFSPIFAPAAATTKYIPVQTGQTQQESGVSSGGSAPVVTQAAVSQQSVPIFRQPPGVHLSHYPTNYLPYNQYLPPQFYLPPPPMHPFLSNATFPQQPQPGSLYPGMGPAGAAPMKYVAQYKSASNVGNPSQFVMPTGSEDLASSRYKENNVYAAGQQSEVSGWIPIPGRDITQSTPFYNLPPSQGQPMTFPGIYHHATQAAAAAPPPGTMHPMLQQSQTMSGGPVEMVGPPSAVYPQPQRTQMNWVNNY